MNGSVITGDVGVSPGTGFANTGCTIAGDTPPATNVAAVPARAAFLSAYAALQSLSTSCIQMPGNLSGLNLAPGVYCTDAVAKAGTLTLTGGANDVWIFLVNGALTGHQLLGGHGWWRATLQRVLGTECCRDHDDFGAQGQRPRG